MIHAREDYDRIQDPAGKIGEDEPVFLIRAQDYRMITMLREYARLCRVDGDEVMARVVEQHIKRTRVWQATNGAKQADL